MELSRPLRFVLTTLAAVAYFALPALSSATPINITINPTTGQPASDINFGLLGNNSPTTNFNFLSSDVSLYNSFYGTILPAPTFDGYANFENLSGATTVSVTGFAYAVLHYGKGPGGAGQGGGIVFLSLNGMTGNYTFAGTGSGPNGLGGLSSIRLFGGDGSTNVPDGGSMVALLGAGLLGVGVARRLVKR
jgi:hypothetical protein